MKEPGDPSFMTANRPGRDLHSGPRKKLSSDALPAGLCRRCGFLANHAIPQDCIDFLRDRLADMSSRLSAKATTAK